MPEIKTCIKDQTGITNELQVIINECKQGFSIPIALDVGHRIGVLVSELPTDLRDCVSLNDDMAKITAWTSGLINDPKRVFANVVKNWDDLITRFKNVPQDFKQGAFEAAGKETADILIDLLGKISDGQQVVVEHNTPFGSWGHYVGQHNDFMPLTHTEWDGHELADDAENELFDDEDHHWGDFDEHALAAFSDDVLEQNAELAETNV